MQKDTVLRNILMLSMTPREPVTITADTLREKLADQGYQVDLRTIQRDLIKNSEVLPIRNLKSPDSNAKCWCWIREAQLLDIPEMSAMTALTFNLVESFLIRLIPKTILGFMLPHFKRAEHLLKKMGTSTWGRWSEKVSIIPRGLNLIPPPIDSSIFETVFEAVIKEKQVVLEYRKRKATQTKKYHLNPLGLVFNQEVIYLVCTKQGLDELQHFALHRMVSAEHLQTRTVVPDGFELKEYVKQGRFQYLIGENKIQLKVIFDPGIAGHLYESKLTEDQILTQLKDGTVQLEADVQNSSALKWWLLGFGEGVEVLEPLALREEFRQIFSKLNLMYDV